ncbi:biopolymer transporter ExbD [candidate division KSB1 bacterium]|nr:biopolymer transporter ExbD [candidate division KSB1 bacterium]
MAYKPSRRRHRGHESVVPNMTPIMNLMVVLIPLLLSSVELIKISIIELHLPPAINAEALQTDQPSEKLKLDLAVTITNEGFYITGTAAIFKTTKGKIHIPMREGQFDYDLLTQKLYEIKESVVGRVEDENAVTIQAEPSIDYQTLVSTMDAARSMRYEDGYVPLFPKASLSALIL